MKIIKRIWLIPTFSAIVFLIFLVGMFAIVWYSNVASDRLLNMSETYQPTLGLISDVSKELSFISESLEDAVITSDVDLIEEAKLHKAALLARIELLIQIDGNRAKLLQHVIHDYLPDVFELADLMMTDSGEDVSRLTQNVVNDRNKVFKHIDEYKNTVEAELRDTVTTTRDEIQDSTTTITIFIAFIFLLMGGGTFVIIRNTSSQLKGLMNFANEVEKGNYNFKVESGSEGEFSSLVNALNSMASSIKSSTDQLNRMAHYDSLTGVPNRRAIMERLRSEVKSVQRHGYSLSFCMCDIDKFKLVNDTFGHQVGDDVISEFAKLLKDEVRMEDVVGRYGGDEFCIILPHTAADAAEHALERARSSLEGKEFFNDDDEVFKVTASFGIAQINQSDDVNILIKKADDALYQAKEGGRNRIGVSLEK